MLNKQGLCQWEIDLEFLRVEYKLRPRVYRKKPSAKNLGFASVFASGFNSRKHLGLSLYSIHK